MNKVTGAMINEAMPHAKAKHGIKAGVYNPTFEEVKELDDTERGEGGFGHSGTH